jgi:heme-degrading monooxygenase HmoA
MRHGAANRSKRVESRNRKEGSAMFMRLVQVKIKTDRLPEFVRLYEEVIIPELGKTKGCQYGGLVQGVQHGDEGISLTLWDSQSDAEQYEKSGAYQRLLEKSTPFFSDSSEWKVQLSNDLQLEYTPVPTTPVVERYADSSVVETAPLDRRKSPSIYFRIVSMKILPEKKEEFRSIYNQDIIPALRAVPGCRYVFLAESIRERTELLSVTVWNSLEEAREYESRGSFRALVEKLRPTFSGLYRWKTDSDDESGEQTVSSEDLSVNAYNVVAGKAFP